MRSETTFIFRDYDTPEFDRESRFMGRVSVLASDPAETARKILDAGDCPYLRFMYEDYGHTFATDDDRMTFWSAWTNTLCREIEQSDETNIHCVCIEHPRVMGARRHHPGWLAFFHDQMKKIRKATDAVVTQFGVPSSGHTFYRLPVPAGLCGEQSNLSTDAIWLNLPGQYVWGDRTTTLDEFILGLAWAKAHRVRNVICWSNPADDSFHAVQGQEQGLKAIEQIYPIVPKPKPLDWLGVDKSDFDAILEFLAKEQSS